jgi:hypothetical protein
VTRLAHQRVACTVFRTRAGAERVLKAAPFMRRRPWRVITGGVDTATFYPDPAAGRVFASIMPLVIGRCSWPSAH